MMRHHRIFTQLLAQIVSDAFGKAACVDEHKRRAVLANQFRNAMICLAPKLHRRHGPQFVVRNFHCEIEIAPVSGVHDYRTFAQKLRDFVQGLDGRRQPDALRLGGGEMLQARQGQCQMRAALIIGNGVDFVHNHRAHTTQHISGF